MYDSGGYTGVIRGLDHLSRGGRHAAESGAGIGRIRTTPHIRLLFIAPQFALSFLQTHHGDALALSLTFGSAKNLVRRLSFL